MMSDIVKDQLRITREETCVIPVVEHLMKLEIAIKRNQLDDPLLLSEYFITERCLLHMQ